MNFFNVAYAKQINIVDNDLSVAQILANILTGLMWVVGAAALVFVIYGGIQFIMSSGDPEKLTKAKKTLLYAVIGIIIVAFSYVIVVSLGSVLSKVI